MSVRCVALRTFAGAGGLVRKGSIIILTAHQAGQYEQAGLVEPLDVPIAPDVTAVVGPSNTATVEPTSKEWNFRKKPAPSEPVVPKHVAGGVYDVAGERIKGKAAAQARADELNGG